uniref:Uncharacterized protein n=1 Tax=Aegilops tauschii subsp. strangulata TaxID=200361 RepID=A0A453A8Y5_AEGTS
MSVARSSPLCDPSTVRRRERRIGFSCPLRCVAPTRWQYSSLWAARPSLGRHPVRSWAGMTKRFWPVSALLSDGSGPVSEESK